MQGMAKPSRLYQFWGCLLTVAFVAAIAWGGLAGAFFAWWGPGFAGAMRARHAPAAVRDAARVTIYDTVVVREGGGVTFRRSLWSIVRASVVAGLVAALLALLIRRQRAFVLAVAVPAAMLWLLVAWRFSSAVHIARGTPGEVVAVPFERGGGRSGTRHTTAWMKGYDIVLRTPQRTTRLIRLPYNEAPDAEVWRSIVAAKLRKAAAR